jgi:FkbM family methyltransferase
MSLRSSLVSWLDENAPALIGAARYRYHVGYRGDIVHPAVTRDLFDRLLSRQAAAIDVGANVGIFTRYLASYFAEVVAVEPIPYLADRLMRSAPANVAVRPVALGGNAGSVTLRVPINAVGNEMPALSTAASGNSLTFIPKTGFVERHVEMQTLDDVAAQIANLAFVKIDVEGFEGSVLAGATRLLQRERPVIQLEIGRAHNPNYLDILSLLGAAGYQVYALQKDGLYCDARRFIEAQPVAVTDDEAASPQGCWDYLLVPDERAETLTAGLIREPSF